MDRKILVLENSAMVRELLDSPAFQATTGWRFLIEADPDRYLERIREVRPDIVLLSNAEAKDGYPTVKALKADPKSSNTPILLLTSARDRLDEKSMLALGVAGFLRKPFQFETLESQIRDLLTEAAREYGTERIEDLELVDDELISLLQGQQDRQSKMSRPGGLEQVNMDALEEELDPTQNWVEAVPVEEDAAEDELPPILETSSALEADDDEGHWSDHESGWDDDDVELSFEEPSAETAHLGESFGAEEDLDAVEGELDLDDDEAEDGADEESISIEGHSENDVEDFELDFSSPEDAADEFGDSLEPLEDESDEIDDFDVEDPEPQTETLEDAAPIGQRVFKLEVRTGGLVERSINNQPSGGQGRSQLAVVFFGDDEPRVAVPDDIEDLDRFDEETLAPLGRFDEAEPEAELEIDDGDDLEDFDDEAAALEIAEAAGFSLDEPEDLSEEDWESEKGDYESALEESEDADGLTLPNTAGFHSYEETPDLSGDGLSIEDDEFDEYDALAEEEDSESFEEIEELELPEEPEELDAFGDLEEPEELDDFGEPEEFDALEPVEDLDDTDTEASVQDFDLEGDEELEDVGLDTSDELEAFEDLEEPEEALGAFEEPADGGSGELELEEAHADFDAHTEADLQIETLEADDDHWGEEEDLEEETLEAVEPVSLEIEFEELPPLGEEEASPPLEFDEGEALFEQDVQLAETDTAEDLNLEESSEESADDEEDFDDPLAGLLGESATDAAASLQQMIALRQVTHAKYEITGLDHLGGDDDEDLGEDFAGQSFDLEEDGEALDSGELEPEEELDEDFSGDGSEALGGEDSFSAAGGSSEEQQEPELEGEEASFADLEEPELEGEDSFEEVEGFDSFEEPAGELEDLEEPELEGEEASFGDLEEPELEAEDSLGDLEEPELEGEEASFADLEEPELEGEDSVEEVEGFDSFEEPAGELEDLEEPELEGEEASFADLEEPELEGEDSFEEVSGFDSFEEPAGELEDLEEAELEGEEASFGDLEEPELEGEDSFEEVSGFDSFEEPAGELEDLEEPELEDEEASLGDLEEPELEGEEASFADLEEPELEGEDSFEEVSGFDSFEEPAGELEDFEEPELEDEEASLGELEEPELEGEEASFGELDEPELEGEDSFEEVEGFDSFEEPAGELEDLEEPELEGEEASFGELDEPELEGEDSFEEVEGFDSFEEPAGELEDLEEPELEGEEASFGDLEEPELEGEDRFEDAQELTLDLAESSGGDESDDGLDEAPEADQGPLGGSEVGYQTVVSEGKAFGEEDYSDFDGAGEVTFEVSPEVFGIDDFKMSDMDSPSDDALAEDDESALAGLQDQMETAPELIEEQAEEPEELAPLDLDESEEAALAEELGQSLGDSDFEDVDELDEDDPDLPSLEDELEAEAEATSGFEEDAFEDEEGEDFSEEEVMAAAFADVDEDSLDDFEDAEEIDLGHSLDDLGEDLEGAPQFDADESPAELSLATEPESIPEHDPEGESVQFLHQASDFDGYPTEENLMGLAPGEEPPAAEPELSADELMAAQMEADLEPEEELSADELMAAQMEADLEPEEELSADELMAAQMEADLEPEEELSADELMAAQMEADLEPEEEESFEEPHLAEDETNKAEEAEAGIAPANEEFEEDTTTGLAHVDSEEELHLDLSAQFSEQLGEMIEEMVHSTIQQTLDDMLPEMMEKIVKEELEQD
ncbi:MAG: hypothetical protein RRB13_13985 [bacterium]|nr:hypothetical protein [bacterium]